MRLRLMVPRPAAAGRLPCDARTRGPAAELAPRPLRGAALRHLRRYGLNVARLRRAGRTSCASRRSTNRLSRMPPTAFETWVHFDEGLRWCGKGVLGWPGGRIGGAEERRAWGPRAQRATFNPTRGACLSAAHAQRARSELRRGATGPSTAGQPAGTAGHRLLSPPGHPGAPLPRDPLGSRVPTTSRRGRSRPAWCARRSAVR